MLFKVETVLLALGGLALSVGISFAQLNNFAEDPDFDKNADPFKNEYPDIVSPVTDCPDIAEKYRSGGANADPLGYPPNFGFSNLSDADKQACIKEINKDGDIVEEKELKEEENILQN